MIVRIHWISKDGYKLTWCCSEDRVDWMLKVLEDKGLEVVDLEILG